MSRAVFERRAKRLIEAGRYKRAYYALLGAAHFNSAPGPQARQLPQAAGEPNGLGAFLSAHHSAQEDR